MTNDSASIDYSDFIIVPRDEIEFDFEGALKKTNDDGPPILVTNGGVAELVIMSWNYFWRRYGDLYTDKEKMDIEQACSHYKDNDANN